ncbi:hypothetical protein [Roseateles saccharophilus]|nr:hypothetical protein [Roseateles saccharophilus]MBL8277985.1 hypothetical protein [Roseateles sp.]MDG0833147.1 hypothetical protein [Roseateles saccharophilus]
MIPTLLAGAAMLMIAVQARAELVEIRFNEQGRFEHSATVAAGKFVEICSKLTKGQALPWTFKSDQPMQFNIHYHEDKKVEFPAKLQSATSAEARLEVPIDQHYCWMWANKGSTDAQLTFSVQK